MKHIKDYMKKIEAMLLDRTKETKSNKKGLLAPTKPSSEKKEQRNELSTIADFVYGIRSAREEMKNGK